MNPNLKPFYKLLHAWKHDERILAVLGLGSLARPKRMDEFSDYDFFLIVKDASKKNFLKQTSWLKLNETQYLFRNTVDGFKAIVEGNVFIECAIFTVSELNDIPYDRPKLYWIRPGVNAKNIPLKKRRISSYDTTYYLEECWSQLYVGLGRYLRGEHFAALHMIQIYAVESYLKATLPLWPKTIEQDPFVYVRRFEQAYPNVHDELSLLLSGYSTIPESAKTLYEKLIQHHTGHPLQSLVMERLKMCQ